MKKQPKQPKKLTLCKETILHLEEAAGVRAGEEVWRRTITLTQTCGTWCNNC